jgi:hypothetical protein
MVNAAGQPQLPEESIRFRDYLITALWDDRWFGYVDKDCFVGRCPICMFAIGVRFAGFAPRASLHCNGGCTEAEIAERLDLQVRP